jgi:hypothetical protein
MSNTSNCGLSLLMTGSMEELCVAITSLSSLAPKQGRLYSLSILPVDSCTKNSTCSTSGTKNQCKTFGTVLEDVCSKYLEAQYGKIEAARLLAGWLKRLSASSELQPMQLRLLGFAEHLQVLTQPSMW